MNTFFNNLFGTIANNSDVGYGSGGTFGQSDFIPIDGAEGILATSGKMKAEWLGLGNRLVQKYAYEYCFPLASIVDRMAESDINGNIQILRANGKGADDFATSDYAKRLNKLLLNPNPSQSWEEFRGQQMIYKKIYGFCPVLPILPAGFVDPTEATMLINLPPWMFDAVPLRDGSGFPKVKEYTLNWIDKKNTYQPSQIFILTDTFIPDEFSNYLLPKSRLVGLDMAISNLCAGMEADNVLLRKKGPLGFISHDAGATKDSVAGYIPMTEKEKKDLQNDLARYGLNWAQYQYVVSRQAVKWNSMSYNVKELGTKDTVIAATKAICWRYNYAYVLLENTDATYANQNSAEKALYQNNIIPTNIKDLTKYGQYFKASENNCKITADFSHLSALQEDAEMQGRARQYANNGLQIEYLNDVITLNQWRTAQGWDTVNGGDVYYSQSELKKAKDEAGAQRQNAKDPAEQQSSAN